MSIRQFANLKILLLQRSSVLSTVSPHIDGKMLSEVGHLLSKQGCTIHSLSEDKLQKSDLSMPDIVLSMARAPQTLQQLRNIQQHGCLIINTPDSVENSNRSSVIKFLDMEASLSDAAPETAWWVKAGNKYGIHAGKTFYCTTKEDAVKLQKKLIQQGYDDTVIMPHRQGTVVKFYGIGQGQFFSVFSEDKTPCRLSEDIYDMLLQKCSCVADKMGLMVYGGDAVISHSGMVDIIDFNDWPSFSPCTSEAAAALFRELKSLF